jgi:hypothetical protein
MFTAVIEIIVTLLAVVPTVDTPPAYLTVLLAAGKFTAYPVSP